MSTRAPRPRWRKAGAIRIYADTSSSERYAGTSDFYQRMGFLKAGTTDLAATPATRSDKSMVVMDGPAK
jgi:hypothetical protein